MADKQSNKPTGPPEEEQRRLLPLNHWSSVMDELFEEAVRDGVFDNLPGQGKPLNLTKNPFGGDHDLAYQLLKDNDYTLPWISERNEITKQVDQFRSKIPKVWQRYVSEYQASRSDTVRLSLKLGWNGYLEELQTRIVELNALIANVNLKQPGERLEILKLSLKQELSRAGAGEELDQDGQLP